MWCNQFWFSYLLNAKNMSEQSGGVADWGGLTKKQYIISK